MNTKISEALIDVADDAYSQHYFKFDTGITRDSMRAALEAVFSHIHPQPAELAEQQGVSLPPLPASSAHDPHTGEPLFSEAKMRLFANAALAAAGRQQAGESNDARAEAFSEFEDDYLTDGNGYAPASTYDACSAAFIAAWPDRAAAYDAAKAEFKRLHGHDKTVGQIAAAHRNRADDADDAEQVGEVQGLDALTEKLVSDWQADGRMQPHAWDYRGFAKDAMTRALAARQPEAQEPVLWSVLQIGNAGAAYDPKGARRAFTYADQPGNIVASNLGRAANEASKASAGDSIDRGLSLLKSLQESGFGVFQIGEYAAPPAQGIDLGQFREAAYEAWKSAEAGSEAEAKINHLLALIDQCDAAPGVGNG